MFLENYTILYFFNQIKNKYNININRQDYTGKVEFKIDNFYVCNFLA